VSDRAGTRRDGRATGEQRGQPKPGAAQSHTGAEALTATLERIAALHADLSRAYGDLARDTANRHAEIAEQSLYASVPDAPREPEFVTAETVGELLKVSARTVQRMAEEGQLPAPVRISPGRVRWRLADLERWFGGPK
jgi:excisionase family DNA binding protein